MRIRRVTLAALALAAAAACAHAPPRGGTAPPDAQLGQPEVPFVATPPEVVDEMLRVAHVGRGDVVYDPGCGDGGMVIAAARAQGVRGVGVDIDPALVAEAERAAAVTGVVGLVTFRRADVLEVDLREATVVTLYLGDKMNLLLRAKLLHELRPGARIVSHNFGMGDWRPDATRNVGWHEVHLWTVPETVPAALRTISPREAERVGDLPY
jgi:SAM-dependent methyltransferase